MDEPPPSPFDIDAAGLRGAIDRLLLDPPTDGPASAPLPTSWPEHALGPETALDLLHGPALRDARDLGAPGVLAHMDPPTPWVSWAGTMWAASKNQNLLHPDTAPVARDLERLVISWLAPWFGMDGGHLTPGSTVANLTALWAARELGATEIVAGPSAHLSVSKAARLLAVPYRTVDWSDPGDLSTSAAVVTAGTTATGEIEPLDAAPSARWRHVDAAWAGPLRLSDRHRALLDGIERADSVAVSAHKWLFQPKESAMVLFADSARAHGAVSTDGSYLAAPNVGVLGSHGATAVPLLATLLAYGRRGVTAWIDRCMELAEELHDLIETNPELEARARPSSGVVCWRHRRVPSSAIRTALSADVLVSSTMIDGIEWLRSVAANPRSDPARVVDGVLAAALAV